MKPLSAEWVAKAEGEFASAQRELKARKLPNFDAACFHAQQCAEKYLKARLQEAGIPFGRSHHLSALLELALPLEPMWEACRADLTVLTAFAVEFRYPGESADRALAQEAVRRCTTFRLMARTSLGLP
jgi:HEPN domain-containing protein